jgi:hypothetical protein
MTRIVPTIPLAMAKALLIARRATLSNLHCAMKGVLRTSARKGATSCETPRALDKHLAAIRDEIAHPGYCHGGTSLSSAQHFIRKRRPRCIGTWESRRHWAERRPRTAEFFCVLFSRGFDQHPGNPERSRGLLPVAGLCKRGYVVLKALMP